MKRTIRLDGTELDVQAGSADKLPRLSLLAYTGGSVVLNGFYWPVVFDLSTTQAAATVPLLFAHNDMEVVGHVDGVEILATKIKASAVLSGANDRTEEIKKTIDNGINWQLSVGLESGQLDFVDSQASVKVNNKTFTGPLYVARQNTLREISIVSLGADSNTVTSLAASYKGGYSMFEEWVTSECGLEVATLTDAQKTKLRAQFDSIKAKNDDDKKPVDKKPVTDTNDDNHTSSLRAKRAAETERCDHIEDLSKQYNRPTMMVNGKQVSIAAHAINEGWTLEKTENAMLKAERPKNSQATNVDDASTFSNILRAAVFQAGKLESHLPKGTSITSIVDEKSLDAAHKRFKSRIGLQEFFLEAARFNGYNGSANFKANGRAILRAAFTSLDLDTVLTQNFNTFLMAGYNSVDSSWRRFTKIGRVNDFKEVTNLRVNGSMVFEELAPDGHIPHAEMSEQTFGNRAKPHGIMIAITYVDFVNDNLGAFTDNPRKMGRGGMLGLTKGAWMEFMDNSAFFVAGNNNVSTGALSVAGLNAALAVFRKLKDPTGEYVMAEPRYLLTPVELAPTADQLYTSTNLAGTASPTTPSDNPHARKYEPITSPYLSDSTITGNSALAYYLLADPNDTPALEVVFLDGVETPTIETADVDFSQLGIQMRGTFHWGVRKQDPNAGVRSTGA